VEEAAAAEVSSLLQPIVAEEEVVVEVNSLVLPRG